MIVFDLQAIQSAAHGERGIARYVGDLATTLAAEHPDVVDVFAWNDRLPEVPRLHELGLGGRLRTFSSLRGRRVDLLHVNSPFELLPYGEIGVPVVADRLVVTCYDMIPYRYPDRYLDDPVTSARYRTRLGMLASADAVVTDSQSAADDVAELVGVPRHRLTVIGAGVGPRFTPPTSSLADRMTELRRVLPDLLPRFVLVPTGMDWRKNVEGAIRAFSLLPPELRARHQLVLSCKVDEHQRRWVEGLVADCGVDGRVLLTGFVDDDDLVRLYQTAELVVFPSFYEGFGLPVLEARRCGARVVCSATSSLPEVLGFDDALFNPWVVDEIADVMGRALQDPSFAATLDAVADPGFSWSDTAERLVAVYRRVRADRPPRPRRPADAPRRLGLVTLLPPTPSGIADHSARIADAIHHELDDVDVTVFVEGTSTAAVRRSYPVHELATLPARWASGELDAVVYCFGNNRMHRDFLPMLRIVPGHAFLHDVRLTGAFDQWGLDSLAAALYDGNPDGSALFAKPIALAAQSVLVQSRHAAELVEGDSGVVAVDVGPLCTEGPLDVERLDDGRAPWVLSLGIADATKRSDVFVAAMDELGRRRPIRAALVGLGGERFVDGADRSAVGGVLATGHVSATELTDWFRRATVLVQLRSVSNGESSGVIGQALSHGVPLVVSDLGAMAELPDEVAVKVPVDVDPAGLATILEELLADGERLDRMRCAARDLAARETPAAQARRIVDAVFGGRDAVRAGSG
jgi:glycosyltransferase involved in cell wall biosynthesis